MEEKRMKRSNDEAFGGGKNDGTTKDNNETLLGNSLDSASGRDRLSPHQTAFEQLEKYRIDKLVQFSREKEYQQTRNKELEMLANFLSPNAETTNAKKSNPILDEIINSQNVENLIKLNIGGKIFTTTRTTIMKRDNMIKVMLNSEFKIDRDESGNILFSDRNPDYFPIILEHLRTGSTTHIGVWEGNKYLTQLRLLLDESEFFGTSKLSESIHAIIGDQEPAADNTESAMVVDESAAASSVNNKMFDDQEKQDEEWIKEFSNITLQERSSVENYFSEVEKQLQKEKEAIIEKEKSLKSFDVTFNVRGVLFKINVEKILKHDKCLFIPMIEKISLSGEKEIFLDRDPTIFSVFFHYIETGTLNIPPEEYKKKQLYKEAKLLNLESFLEYFNPLRFPIELIGEENIKIKKEEDILRRMFATDRENPILNDPHLHLQSVFGKDGHLRRSFKIKEEPSNDIGLLFDFENPVDASDLCTPKNRLTVPTVPEICDSKESFYAQFNAFTYGMFRNMDWNNIFIAGGSIIATALKIPEKGDKQKQVKKKEEKKNNSWDHDDGDKIEQDETTAEQDAIDNSDNEYFSDSDYEARGDDDALTNDDDDWLYKYDSSTHSNVQTSVMDEKLAKYYAQSSMWKDSDIDIFLYALTPEQAEEKILYLYDLFKKNLKDVSPNIYSTVRESASITDGLMYNRSIRRYLHGHPLDQKEDLSNDIMIFRTEHAITFRFNNPVRCVQIITRLYKSPSEILIGFDIPTCAIGFDGHEIYCLPRTRKAISTRCNLVDPDRQSTTFETRLVKYALRGFRIGVPAYNPNKIVRKTLVTEQFYQRHNLKSVTGLARILLLRSAYKYCEKRHRIFTRISGCGSNLKNTDKVLTTPSNDHDYIQVDFSEKTPIGLHIFNSKLANKIDHLTEEKVLPKKPYFEFAMNDIERIIKPKPEQQISDLPPKIVWLTVEPGRQSIGSFHPCEQNFFQDAYTSNSSMKRKFKVFWYWQNSYKWQKYDKEACVTLETYYRTRRNSSKFYKIDSLDNLEVNFRSLSAKSSTGKTFRVRREKQTKSKLFPAGKSGGLTYASSEEDNDSQHSREREDEDEE